MRYLERIHSRFKFFAMKQQPKDPKQFQTQQLDDRQLGDVKGGSIVIEDLGDL